MTRFFRWLRRLWWAQQRGVDLAVLWPICKEQATTLDHAKAAFAVHAFNDDAWIGEYGAGLSKQIDQLE